MCGLCLRSAQRCFPLAPRCRDVGFPNEGGRPSSSPREAAEGESSFLTYFSVTRVVPHADPSSQSAPGRRLFSYFHMDGSPRLPIGGDTKHVSGGARVMPCDLGGAAELRGLNKHVVIDQKQR